MAQTEARGRRHERKEWVKEQSDHGNVLLLVVGLCLGMFLSLWLSSRAVERLLSKLTELTNSVVRETAVAMNPPPIEATMQPNLYQQMSLADIDPDNLEPDVSQLPWAVGMTPEDLRAGIDPWTGRPLR